MVTWEQDCDLVCHQGLYLRIGNNIPAGTLAGLSGSMSVSAGDGSYFEQQRWTLDAGAEPDADGLIRLVSITPPLNGPAELRIALDLPLPEDATGALEFEFWPEMCGLEQMSATASSGIAILSGLLAGVLGLVLFFTRRPLPQAPPDTIAA